jgi:Zn-dependent M28 family amino/carboxypeptidase
MRKFKINLVIILSIQIFLSTNCSEEIINNNTVVVDVDTKIENIINSININTVGLFVRELSGDKEVEINGQPYRILSRGDEDPGNELAADYIEQKLKSYGLSVTNQNFLPTGRNVIGIQYGCKFPNQYYIICAHYDSHCFPEFGDTAPGADDNASGTAVVLEAARILSNYSVKSSIIYGLWDMEEYGMKGSPAYAQYCDSTNMNLLGIVNVDMLGWDGDNDSKLVVAIGGFEEFLNQTNEVNEKYNLGIIIKVSRYPTVSDDISFYMEGFDTIGFEENIFPPENDFNPYYHTPDEKWDKFNQDYFLRNSRLIIATLSKLVL